MKHGATSCTAPATRRRADGSIDHDYYVARAKALREAEISRLLRALTTWLRRHLGR